MSSNLPSCVETVFGRLVYVIDGAGEGPPLVLLQRYRGTIEDWDPDFIDKLARHRRVIRFDSAGIGRSEGEVPLHVADMAQIARAFIEALELTQVDLLGWSLGGYIAQVLALDAPLLIRRLVIAGSGPGGVTECSPRRLDLPKVAVRSHLGLDDLAFLFAAPTDTSRLAMEIVHKRIKQMATGPHVDFGTGQRQRAAIVAWTSGGEAARPRLSQLALPVLVAGGTHDLVLPSYGSFVISQEAPQAKLVLYPDAGHGFLFQHADGFIAELANFLA